MELGTLARGALGLGHVAVKTLALRATGHFVLKRHVAETSALGCFILWNLGTLVQGTDFC